MKKVSLLAMLCCLLILCALPALAEDQSLPVFRITYPADTPLTQEETVTAQVTMLADGHEETYPAQLRLNDSKPDGAERALPQQSLRFEFYGLSFILYNGGNDALRTKVLDAVCSDLIEDGPVAVPVGGQSAVEVYVNDDYRGLYLLQGDIVDTILSFEALESTDTLNITDVNNKAICGDPFSIAAALEQIKGLDLSLEADRQTLATLLDTESFLNWLAVNTFFGNGNMRSDIIFYQVDNGTLKCAMGDFAYVFMSAATNPYASMNDASSAFTVDILQRKLLNQSEYRDAFLTKLGALYQALSVQKIQQAVDAENEKIATALSRHTERWADEFAQAMSEKYIYPVTNAQEALLYQQYSVYRLRDKTLLRQPWYLYDLTQSELNVSNEDMLRYFGSEKAELAEVPTDNWEAYKAAHQ